METIIKFIEFVIVWFNDIIDTLQKRYHEGKDLGIIPTEAEE